jgi:hypothetical protein
VPHSSYHPAIIRVLGADVLTVTVVAGDEPAKSVAVSEKV